jgi:hypothetical protein
MGRRSLLHRAGMGGLAVATAGGAVAVLAGAAQAQTSTTAAGPASSPAATTVPVTTTTLPPQAPQPSDIALMAFAQTLELALVQLYDVVLGSGHLDASTTPVIITFQSHHRGHGQSYAAFAGKAATSRANAGLLAQYIPRLQAATTQNELFSTLFDLENAAAGAYAAALARVIGTNPAGLVASILPIEAGHAVVLGQASGVTEATLVPTFEPTDNVPTPEQFPIVEQ